LASFSSAPYRFVETSLLYIHGDTYILLPFRLLVLAMVMIVAVAEKPLVWATADVAMGFMALINLVALILLSGIVVKLLRDYEEQRRHGVEPRFDKRRFPEIARRLADNVW
jgi:AGCS family alanine or glycine:cation symporter